MTLILIVYASRYGSTTEIAQEIAETLEQQEIIVDMYDLRGKVEFSELNNYDGVLIGSGIKMGKWVKEALNFLKKNKKELKNKPLAVFVTSGEAANPKLYKKAKERYIEKILAKNEIEGNIMYEAFGGVFDFSSNSNYNFIEKKILKRVANSDRTGFIIVDGKLNDFRNWQLIHNWAKDFGNLVKRKFSVYYNTFGTK